MSSWEQTMEAAPSADVSYRLAPDVVWLDGQDGTARLLNLRGSFFALSRIAAEMLRLALRQGIPATVEQISSQYHVAPHEVETDLQPLLSRLHRSGVLARTDHSQRVQTSYKELVAAGLFRCLLIGAGSLDARAWRMLAFARVAFPFLGWPTTIRVFARQSDPQRWRRKEAQPTVGQVDRAVRAAASRHWLQVECKERAAACWCLLRQSGIPAKLIVGVNLFPLEGHCWCEAGGEALSDYPDRCDSFTPVVEYGGAD
jgi:Transglutaminase-like superfamily